jgi:hypothetical protein
MIYYGHAASNVWPIVVRAGPATALAGGGQRMRLGQQLAEPVRAADPLDQHLGSGMTCRTGCALLAAIAPRLAGHP